MIIHYNQMGLRRSYTKVKEKKKATKDFLEFLETKEGKKFMDKPITIFSNGFNCGWKKALKRAKKDFKRKKK